MTCDTCTKEFDKLWMFAHGGFIAVLVKPNTLESHVIDIRAGDWGCCDACAAALQAHDLDAMIACANQPGNEWFLRPVYSRLFQELAGSMPRLWTKEQTEAFWKLTL